MKKFLSKYTLESIGGLLSAILWAFSGIALSLFSALNGEFSSQIGTLKFGIMSAFIVEIFMLLCSLIIVVIIKKQVSLKTIFPFHNKKIWVLILSSLLGAPLGSAMYMLAIVEIGAFKASSLSTLYPILATMCVYIFMRKKSSWNTILGLIIAVSSAVSFGLIAGYNEPSSWKGYVYIAVAVVSWGLEAFLSSISLENNIDPYVSIFIRSLTSVLVFAAVLVPAFGGYNKTQNLSNFIHNSSWYIIFLFLAALLSSVSFMFYYRALNKLSVPKATSINITYSLWTMIFEPILITVGAWKPSPWYVYVLGVMILVGAIIGLLEFKPKNKQSAV
ncbi:DMT family transporter [Mycoplasma simbae]|uniref:DMT family transporter n=1 Tax=Mycoplasma simbae TaxID=36744 RepID=UPI000A6F08CC|nr:DMT family transporter [Mycoplasma simbae]